jgi:MraZ protein
LKWGEAVSRFDHTIDEKGRVSLPAEFRDRLQSDGIVSLHITNFISDRGKCLELFKPREWERLIGKIRQNNSFDSKMRLFQTFYIGGAHEVQIDKQGRILIPPRLREFAHLDREVTFSTLVDRFELWDKRALDGVLGLAEEEFKKTDAYKGFPI